MGVVFLLSQSITAREIDVYLETDPQVLYPIIVSTPGVPETVVSIAIPKAQLAYGSKEPDHTRTTSMTGFSPHPPATRDSWRFSRSGHPIEPGSGLITSLVEPRQPVSGQARISSEPPSAETPPATSPKKGQKQERTSPELITSETEIDSLSVLKKSPTGALIRSALLPGWGQLYNGRYLKAGLILGAESFLATEIVLEDRKIRASTSDAKRDLHTRRRNTFAIWLAGTILYSMIDAYVDAHLFGFEEEMEKWANIRLIPKGKGLEAMCRIRFH
ncbi:MAG TPA: hypothetical protein EYP53_01275 [Candidatus Latescibacteria bacterium]|nr:hypothetical protein [Candidatus Latescibacterota bacterium]